MSSPLRTLRSTLAFVALELFIGAYLFATLPPRFVAWFAPQGIDNLHRAFSLSVACFLIALGIAAIMALLQPTKRAGIVAILLLAHFLSFVADIIIAARGWVSTWILVPDMIFLLVVCVMLIRFFPLRDEEVTIVEPSDGTPDTPAEEAEEGAEVPAPEISTAENPVNRSGMDSGDVHPPSLGG